MMISEHADPVARPGAKEAGGQNVYVHQLAKEMGRRGWYVDIFTRWDNSQKRQVIQASQRVRVIRIKSGPKKYVSRDHLFDYMPEFAKNISLFIEKHKLVYSLIHAHYWMSGWSGLKLKEKYRIPLFMTYHSLGYVRYHTLKKYKMVSDSEFFRFRIKWERELAEKSDVVVATSPFEKQDIIRYYDVKAKNTIIIPVGIDPKMFKQVEAAHARTKIGQSLHGYIILYVGRIEWRKGIGTIISALGKLTASKTGKYRHHNIRLLIVGRKVGPEAKEVRRLIRLAKTNGVADRIQFLGSKDQNKLHYYYSAANICVASSYYEPFGIVPLEALSSGVPVVASKIGGLQYTSVDGKTGKLVPPRNPVKLAEAIDEVLENEKKYRRSVRQYAQTTLKKEFTWPKIAVRMEQAYNKEVKKY